MSAQEQQDSQKTVVAFIAGLLIGGLLVWVFSGDTHDTDEVKTTKDAPKEIAVKETTKTEDNTKAVANETKDVEKSTPEMKTGKGAISVSAQKAGAVVALDAAEFPSDEGWIGVRDYNNGRLTGLLGVARFSKEQGLIPSEIELLRATEAGNTYAVVFYTESGDRKFSSANDVQVENVMETFVAN